MEWIQILVMILGNAAWILPIFFWVRSESREDIRHCENQIYCIREMIREMHKEWMEESKSFHARLCDIEAKRGK